jgi:hypothetical protein
MCVCASVCSDLDDLHTHDKTVVALLLHYCHTVVTLLLHCCYTVVPLLSHCCYTVVTLLLHCCYTVVTRLLHGCNSTLMTCTPTIDSPTVAVPAPAGTAQPGVGMVLVLVLVWWPSRRPRGRPSLSGVTTVEQWCNNRVATVQRQCRMSKEWPSLQALVLV